MYNNNVTMLQPFEDINTNNISEFDIKKANDIANTITNELLNSESI